MLIRTKHFTLVNSQSDTTIGNIVIAASKYELCVLSMSSPLETISWAKSPTAATSRTRHELGDGVNGPDMMLRYCLENPGLRIGYQIWTFSKKAARAL